MAIDEAINKILKELWRLDEKILSGDSLSEEEKDFYNTHLHIIQAYYSLKNEYWKIKEQL